MSERLAGTRTSRIARLIYLNIVMEVHRVRIRSIGRDGATNGVSEGPRGPGG